MSEKSFHPLFIFSFIYNSTAHQLFGSLNSSLICTNIVAVSQFSAVRTCLPAISLAGVLTDIVILIP